MININPGHNSSLQKNCKPLYNYIQYVSRVSCNKKKGMSIKDAVVEAVDWAIKENLLNGFFKLQKEEILAVSLTEFDAETVYRDWKNEGIEIGREEGSQQKAIEDTKNLLQMKIGTPEQISKAIGLPLEKVLELKKEVSVTV